MIPAGMATSASASALALRNTISAAEALNTILADIFALYLKTKNFHWHMTGAALSRLSPIAGRSGGGNLLGC